MGGVGGCGGDGGGGFDIRWGSGVSEGEEGEPTGEGGQWESKGRGEGRCGGAAAGAGECGEEVGERGGVAEEFGVGGDALCCIGGYGEAWGVVCGWEGGQGELGCVVSDPWIPFQDIIALSKESDALRFPLGPVGSG